MFFLTTALFSSSEFSSSEDSMDWSSVDQCGLELELLKRDYPRLRRGIDVVLQARINIIERAIIDCDKRKELIHRNAFQDHVRILRFNLLLPTHREQYLDPPVDTGQGVVEAETEAIDSARRERLTFLDATPRERIVEARERYARRRKETLKADAMEDDIQFDWGLPSSPVCVRGLLFDDECFCVPDRDLLDCLSGQQEEWCLKDCDMLDLREFESLTGW